MLRATLNINNISKRLYSASAPASKGKGLAFAAAVTAGVLAGGYLYSNRSSKKSETASSNTSKNQVAPALNPSEFIPFKLSEVVSVSPNTSIFRFKLEEGQTAGLSVASCLLTMIPVQKEGDKVVVRPYTPITHESTTGYMDLLIKSYPAGLMSNHIFNLSVGDELLIKGPITKLNYEPNMRKEIGMIAGGTGITPMLQVINKITENSDDHTKVNLLFANNAEEDILLKDHLDSIEKKYPGKLKVHYVLSKPSQGWTGETGFVNADMIKKYLPSSSLGEDAMVFVCGPPGMMNAMSGPKNGPIDQGELSGILKELGYAKENVFKF
ncbi:hypothetical protein BB561_001528 [Smittium simulii]|uniref:cytochrome-b5 reductase n=1 Tax=Smittium simulii TaxID=133385 RepID=A0A2T9YUE5_9FUNG|nr:hypothetical protein BB561_001528 [Smittium simulii]